MPQIEPEETGVEEMCMRADFPSGYWWLGFLTCYAGWIGMRSFGARCRAEAMVD